MKYELKMLAKSKVFYLVLAACLIIWGFYVKHIVYLQGEVLEYDDPIFWVRTIIRYAVFYFVALLVCAVVYFDIYRKYDMKEALEAISYRKAEKKQMLCFVLVHIFITLLFVIGMCGLYMSMGEYEPVLIGHMCLNILINYGLVGVLAILIGKNISNMTHAIVKLLVLAGVVLLVSQIKIELLAGTFIDLSFLEIFPENIDFIPNGYIGYVIQLQRVMVILFWICLQLVLLGFYYKKQIIQTGIWGLLMIASFVMVLLPRTNLTSMLLENGSIYATNMYYWMGEQQAQQKKVDFEVTSYRMDLNIKNQLYAKVTMELASDQKPEKYFFTLYHEYKITSIYDENGNQLKYAHSGDYLAIDAKEALQTVTIEYEGTGTPYYSEYVGTYLTPGFPFFPIAGYHIVFNRDNLVFENLELDEKTDFFIKIHSDKKYYCNLPEVEKNVFKGKSKELFLLNGMVEEYKIGETRFLFPTTYNKALVIEYIDTFMGEYEKKEETFRKSLKNKTFVWMPIINCAEREVFYDDLVMCCLFEPKYLSDYYQTQYVNQLMEEEK